MKVLSGCAVRGNNTSSIGNSVACNTVKADKVGIIIVDTGDARKGSWTGTGTPSKIAVIVRHGADIGANVGRGLIGNGNGRCRNWSCHSETVISLSYSSGCINEGPVNCGWTS